MNRSFIFFCLLFTLNNALAGCLEQNQVQSKGRTINFAEAKITNAKGETSPIASINDNSEITILHFWATWCTPCLKELPELDASIQLAEQKGYSILPINSVAADGEKSAALFNRLKLTNIPLLFDTNDLFRQLKLLGMPATIVFDANGLEIKRAYGALPWNCEDLLDELSN